jgi:hypothetical protein
MQYGYTEYVEQALRLAGRDAEDQEMREYEHWTPYQDDDSHDQLQGAAEDEPRSSTEGGS